MATLTVTCTGSAQDLADFCAALGYSSALPDPANPGQTVPNPETQTQFFQRKIRQHAAEVVKSYRTNKSAEEARTAAITSNSSFTF